MTSATQKAALEPVIRNLVDIDGSEAAMASKADMVLEQARWAAQVFQRYDRARTQAIVQAVAEVAHAKAGDYAARAVAETGFGVAAHKQIKNELSSLPLVAHYRDWDFVNPRLNAAEKMVEIPRPAGVVFALAPSTNPIATVYFKILAALMTRNAIIVSPHPAALEISREAIAALAEAAVAAGAPAAVIQAVETPSLPLIDQFMRSPKTDVILATGGGAMVRAAYASSNPAIGVGPGNAPVFVDPSADLAQAAKFIVDSKSFDNSILCTNESVLIVLAESESGLLREMKRAGAYLCDAEETERLRRLLFHERGFNVEMLGRDAAWIAEQAGIKVPAKTRVLLTPIHLIGVDEPLSREKLCPVLGVYIARSKAQALMQARQLLRFGGAGHSAAIHARDQQTVLDYAAAVEVYRVVVNAPCSQGAAGFATHLAPSFTIGTGFFGRSSIGENIGPQHLVSWTRIAWNKESAEILDAGLLSRLHHPGPLPEAPSDGVPGKTRPSSAPPAAPQAASGRNDDLRDEIRRIIAEELRAALKG
ncbi:MAG: aldehyde dehydrogenase family protein [Rhodospirillales bacterium]